MEAACEMYEESLPGSVASRYLEARGISSEAQISFRLGYVDDPSVGHERYRGRLAIPYLTPTGVVSIRFRSIPNEDGIDDPPKYLSLPGEISRIFNTPDLKREESYICVCEGEIDTITAHMCGLPAIGIPGSKNWKKVFSRALRWYQHVFVLADADDKGAGAEFAETVAKQVRNVSIVPMPGGHDVSSFVLEAGQQALRERIGLD